MKIPAAPQIAGLDALLDVLIHPEKLAATLQQLAAMRDAVAENLEVYDTKQKADDYLAQASAALREADERKRASVQFVEAQTAAIAVRQAELVALQQRCAEVEQAQQKQTLALREHERQLNEKAALLAERADDLDTREAAVQDALTALSRKQQAMDQEVEKMKQRIALFSQIQ